MRAIPSINFSSTLRSAGLIFFIGLFPVLSFSQQPDSVVEKLSIALRSRNLAEENKPQDFIIAVKDHESFRSFLVKQPGIFTKQEYPATGTWIIRATGKEIMEKISRHPAVIFIDMPRIPVEEVAVSNLDISANRINMVHRWYPQVDGQSLTVSVKEHRPDTLDIDLRGRYISSPLASAQLSGHATIMSTIIAGAGNSFYEGRGAATAANVTSFNFMNLLPEPDATYQQYNVTVQNHSYGTAIDNYYGAEAAAHDASVISRPQLMHVFSAGNSGTQSSTAGPYAGVNGFANITGNMKMAKNIITVGHVDSVGNVLPASSRGPAYDGRLKPELVAFGEDGSSGAAAIVSGIALLVQDAHRQQYGQLPIAALTKAILLHTADDVSSPGIDFTSGYGMANAYKAVQKTLSGQHLTGVIPNGTIHDMVLIVPPNTPGVKITLAWSDPAATVNAAKALTRDLDLELELPSSGLKWLPWVLNHYPHRDSVSKLPVRGRDSLNVVEQISLVNPPAGNYILHIKAANSPVSFSQQYAIVYSFDTVQQFHWDYPTKLDNLFAGRQNTLRWQSTFTSTGQLEWSVDNGSSWQLIASNLDLSLGYYKWIPPVNFETVMLRMTVASQTFVTDTITISDRMDLRIGFSCPDSFALWWNRIPTISQYILYRLGGRYMEAFSQTSDTMVVLQKQSNPSFYYAVSPVIDGKAGLRSYAYDYRTQGVDCYFKSFFAVLNGNTINLNLELGTVHNIRKITWEKLITSGYVSLGDINSFQTLLFNHTDNSPKKGLNTYRVRIELVNGQVIYSQPETVYYFAGADYLVYPNPVRRGESLNLVNNDPGSLEIQVLNSMGEMLYETRTDNQAISIPTGKFSKGLYFIRLIKANSESVIRVIVM